MYAFLTRARISAANFQMVDDHNLVASEPLFDSDCSCFSGPDKCDFCRNPMREITEV